jgi:hypothetical protein
MPPRTSRTRARRGSRWYGPRDRNSCVWPRQAQRGPTALFGPGARPLQELVDSAFGHTDRAGDLLRHQGGPLRRGDHHGQLHQGPLVGRMPEPVVGRDHSSAPAESSAAVATRWIPFTSLGCEQHVKLTVTGLTWTGQAGYHYGAHAPQSALHARANRAGAAPSRAYQALLRERPPH